MCRLPCKTFLRGWHFWRSSRFGLERHYSSSSPRLYDTHDPYPLEPMMMRLVHPGLSMMIDCIFSLSFENIVQCLLFSIFCLLLRLICLLSVFVHASTNGNLPRSCFTQVWGHRTPSLVISLTCSPLRHNSGYSNPDVRVLSCDN